jgi:hypothetical protein
MRRFLRDGRRPIAVALAGLLAEATKDRPTDYLICAAKDHPSLAAERLTIASGSIADRLSILRDGSFTLPHRAMAAWYASGTEWSGERQVGFPLAGAAPRRETASVHPSQTGRRVGDDGRLERPVVFGISQCADHGLGGEAMPDGIATRLLFACGAGASALEHVAAVGLIAGTRSLRGNVRNWVRFVIFAGGRANG